MTKRGATEFFVLDERQRAAFVRACDNLTERIVVKVPLFAGLRVSELAHMHYGWVTRLSGRGRGGLSIPPREACDCSECANDPQHPGLWMPKSKAAVRVVPIVPALVKDLEELFTLNPKGLRNAKRERLSRYSIHHLIQRIGERAGIRYPGGGTVFPHALRATFASMLAEQGFTAPQICYLCGWSSLAVAQKYINRSEAMRGAQRRMQDLDIG